MSEAVGIHYSETDEMLHALLNGTEEKNSSSGITVHTLSDGRKYMVAVAYGNPDVIHQASQLLTDQLADEKELADWCVTMQRRRSECGCPDCGSSLVDVGP